ncbi:sialin-like [Chironomus tepperi]|uniref:sialin-like n=1 Tax=Chironomus tepperi TaxID=113505 RepID=UPI00391FA7AB
MTEGKETPIPFYLRKRYLIVFLIFLGYFNLYTNRVNLSVAIVAMTENHTIYNDDGSISYHKDFEFDSKEKGFALGAFYYGYITTHFLGGVLATKYGGHLLFNFGLFGTALFSMITPFMCHHGIGYLIAVRVIVGVCSGFSFAAANDVLSKWIPPAERSRSAGYIVAGMNAGTFIANLGWSVLWFVIVYRSPENDPWITKEEKQFITDSLVKNGRDKAASKTPWKDIFTSLPVWAIVVAQTTYNWGFHTLLAQLPLYLDEVLDFNLEESAMISALPYLVLTVLVFVSGFIADWMLKKNFMSITKVRKIFNNSAFILQMVFLMAAGFLTSPVLIIVCITLSVGFGAPTSCGYTANLLDIAPQFSSIISGISSTIATMPGMISPPLSGFIATTPSAFEYRIIFMIACGMYLFGTVFYGIFASGDVQPWALVETAEPVHYERFEHKIIEKKQEKKMENVV